MTQLQPISAVHKFEAMLRELPQLVMATRHTLHAGVYTRTIKLPKNASIVSAFIKIPTTLVITGHCLATFGDDCEAIELSGTNVLTPSAGRKTAYVTLEETTITMIFATRAQTLHEAEAEFTDDVELLMSQTNPNNVTITAEQRQCLER